MRLPPTALLLGKLNIRRLIRADPFDTVVCRSFVTRALSSYNGTTNNFVVPKDGWSHVKGVEDQPLVVSTLYKRLLHTAEQFGDRDALVVCDGRTEITKLSYAELVAKVDEYANGMAATLGVKPGDRVGIWMPNNCEWVLAKYAALKLGAIVVNINPAYKARELHYALNLVNVNVLFAVPRVGTSLFSDILRQVKPEETVPSLRHTVVATGIQETEEDATRAAAMVSRNPNALLFEEVCSSRDPKVDEPKDLDPFGAANIQFTSGTTGSPKGACLNHVSIVNNSRGAAMNQKLTEKDRVCIPVPLYHCFGLVLGNFCCVEAGATMVYPAAVFDPRKTLECVEQQRCTSLYGVPTMFIAQLADPEFDSYNLASLRTGIMAGSNCPIELMKKVIGKMNLRDMTCGYGQTEVAPLNFMSTPEVPVTLRCETVGRVMPHVEVKVVDEGDNVVPVGQKGELWTRGYSVMLGYYNDEEKTKLAVTQDGWMKSGDLVCLDEDGYLRIVGRIKDVVIRGGENLYPREIEEVILEMPEVIDVQIVGVSDPFYGEELCAVVIFDSSLNQDELDNDLSTMGEAVRNYVRGKLSHQKVPKHVRFRNSFNDVLTVSGKIQKFKLREIMEDELKLRPST